MTLFETLSKEISTTTKWRGILKEVISKRKWHLLIQFYSIITEHWWCLSLSKKIVIKSMKTAYPSSRISNLQIPCCSRRTSYICMLIKL